MNFNQQPKNYVQTDAAIVAYRQNAAPGGTNVNIGDWWDDTSVACTFKICTSTGPIVWSAVGGGGAGGGTPPSGANTNVQYNDTGSFGGDAGFTYNKNTNSLTLTGTVSASNISGSTSGTNTGDQTSVSGNAGTVTGLTTNGHTLSLSGNASLSGTTSGTNTGDQTNISGNAATVTTNANLTGPVTSSGNATAISNGVLTPAMDQHSPYALSYIMARGIF